MSGRPPAPAPLPIAVVDNHTHLDIARDDGDGAVDLAAAIAAGAGGRRRPAGPGRLRPAERPVHRATSSTSTRRARRRSPCTPTRCRGSPSRGELDEAYAEIERLAAHPRIRVDRRDRPRLLPHRPRGRCRRSRTSFRWHIDLAKRTGKALQIHDRDAHDDVLRILDEEGRPSARSSTASPATSRWPASASSAATTSLRRHRDVQERAGPARRAVRDPARPAARRDRRAVPHARARTAGRPTRRTSCRSPSGRWPACSTSTCRRLCRAVSDNCERVYGPWWQAASASPRPPIALLQGDIRCFRATSGAWARYWRRRDLPHAPLPKFDLSAGGRPWWMLLAGRHRPPPDARQRGRASRSCALSGYSPVRRVPGWSKPLEHRISRPLAARSGAVLTAVVAAPRRRAHDKAVTLSVDGTPRRRTSSAAPSVTSSTTRASPSARTTSSSPAASAPLADGDKVVVRYGRLLTVTVDGKTDRLLDHRHHGRRGASELGLRGRRRKLSVSRSQTIGRQGLPLTVTTPKAVTVKVDGKTTTKTITAATVGDALTAARASPSASPTRSTRRSRRPRRRRQVSRSRSPASQTGRSRSPRRSPSARRTTETGDLYRGQTQGHRRAGVRRCRHAYAPTTWRRRQASRARKATTATVTKAARRPRCRRRHQGPAPAEARAGRAAAHAQQRSRRRRLNLGRRGVWDRIAAVRVRRQLGHQHRQRLLRRPAVPTSAPGRRTAAAVRAPRRPGHAASSRSPSPNRSTPTGLAVAATRTPLTRPRIAGAAARPRRVGAVRCLDRRHRLRA